MKINTTSAILILVNTPEFDIENPNSAVANYIKTIRDCIQKEGIQVDVWPKKNNVVTITDSNKKNKKTIFENVKTIFKRYFPFLYYSLILNRIFSFQKKQFDSLKDKKYQLIIEFYTIGSKLGRDLKQKNNSKLLLIYDCPVLEQFREMHHTATIFDKQIAEEELKSIMQADCILCYSSSVKKYIKEKYKVKTNFFIMPCIVWKEVVLKEKKPSNDIVIGFVGSFLSWHKVPLLLKAFEVIAKEYSNAKLILVGYGEEWNHVNKLREQSIYKERIVLTGYVSEKELEELKTKITIGIMPGSNWYGSPLKLFEYAQSRIPIIAPSSPVVKDLFVDNETVLLIDSTNELDSLIKNIKRLLEDDVLAKYIAQNAFNLMNGAYSKDQQMNNFINLVQNLMRDGIKK